MKQIKIPVIAAGGIGDGRTFLAALAMGAEAVYIGTAFMATKECPVPDSFKKKLVDSKPDDQDVRNHVLWSSTTSQETLDKLKQKRRNDTPEQEEARRALWTEGYEMRFNGSFAVAFIDGVTTCKELIDGMIGEAEDILSSDNPLARAARALPAKSS